MTTYTMGYFKGGSGKSSTACHLAVYLAQKGRKVWLIDTDEKLRSSITWATIRTETNIEPLIACDLYENAKLLRGQYQLKAQHYDDVIFDCGGGDSGVLRTALFLSDVLIVPFQPRGFDTWPLSGFNDLVEEVQSQHDGLSVHCFLSMADPGYEGSDNRESAEALQHYSALPWSNVIVVRRKQIAKAVESGMTVFEQKPQDFKAVKEFNKLFSLVVKEEPSVEAAASA